MAAKVYIAAFTCNLNPHSLVRVTHSWLKRLSLIFFGTNLIFYTNTQIVWVVRWKGWEDWKNGRFTWRLSFIKCNCGQQKIQGLPPPPWPFPCYSTCHTSFITVPGTLNHWQALAGKRVCRESTPAQGTLVLCYRVPTNQRNKVISKPLGSLARNTKWEGQAALLSCLLSSRRIEMKKTEKEGQFGRDSEDHS